MHVAMCEKIGRKKQEIYPIGHYFYIMLFVALLFLCFAFMLVGGSDMGCCVCVCVCGSK